MARRPQQLRSLRTRRRLLDATLATLQERGFAAASTTAVCSRAGVSQGALFKHFGSKSGLLAAAVAHLFEELVLDYRRAFAGVASSPDRIAAAIRLLWQTFTSPRLEVAFELYTAARSDAELRAALAPVLQTHRQNLRQQARQLFPEAGRSNPRFDAVVDLVLNAMQGAAVGRLVLAEDDDTAAELAVLEAFARQELERQP